MEENKSQRCEELKLLMSSSVFFFSLAAVGAFLLGKFSSQKKENDIFLRTDWAQYPPCGSVTKYIPQCQGHPCASVFLAQGRSFKTRGKNSFFCVVKGTWCWVFTDEKITTDIQGEINFYSKQQSGVLHIFFLSAASNSSLNSRENFTDCLGLIFSTYNIIVLNPPSGSL